MKTNHERLQRNKGYNQSSGHQRKKSHQKSNQKLNFVMNFIKLHQPAQVRTNALNNFNSLFTSALNHLDSSYGSDHLRTAPAVNIVETPTAFELEVAAAGYTKESFSITLEKDILSIKGKKETNETETQPNYRRREFAVSNFNREFRIGDKVNAENIAARYENGILFITLPKKEVVEPATRSISVE